MNLSRVLFVSDCLHLVDFVNGGNGSVDWRCSDIMEDSRISFSSFYIKRLKNKLADQLARRARKFSLKDNWVSVPPFLDSLTRKEPIVDVCKFLLC